MLRLSSFYLLYHRICLRCKDESSLPPQKLILTRCSGSEWKGIISLMSAISQRWSHTALMWH